MERDELGDGEEGEEEEYDYEALKEAGKASYAALAYGKGLIKPGASMLEIAESVEAHILGMGMEMAFPVNISVNGNAAHYTPSFDDASVIPENGIVKLDVGARKGRYLGDCALTVDLSGSHSGLVDAAQAALEAAIGMVRAGRQVCEIGAEIAKVAAGHGVVPIRNLGGHGVERHDLHASVFIPNFDNGDTTELEEGQVIAIEPFVTDGEGYVREGETVEIFQKVGRAAVRSGETRAVAAFIDENYLTYPFAARWLHRSMKGVSEFAIRKAIIELAGAEALEPFPVLAERRNGMVAQAEKEMIVEKDSCTIVTQ